MSGTSEVAIQRILSEGRLSRRQLVKRVLALVGGAYVSAACAPAAAPAPTPASAPTAAPKATAAVQGQPTAAAAVAPTSAPAAAKPSEPSEWIVALNEEAVSLDPNFGSTTSAVGGFIYLHIYSTLYDFDLLPDRSGYKQKPMLAESYRLLNDTTWEFKLRKGVKFHNGDDFTAEDVKYTLEDYMGEKTIRPYVRTSIDKVEIVDPVTVRIFTKGIQAGLIATLQRSPILPMKFRSQVGPEVFNQKPIGNGPYKVVEWVKGQHLLLEADPRYFEGTVFPQRLVLRVIPDPTTRAAELKTGGVQVIAQPAAAQLRELETSPDTDLLVSSKLGLGGLAQHYLVNTAKKPFDDVRVRQEANYAVDREGILKNVVEGRGELLRGPFSSGWSGFDPNLPPYPYDPARAKQLLAEAGFPSGLETELSTTNGVWLKDNLVAEALASQLAEVGIRARLITKEAGKLLADRLAGSFDGITLSPWGAGPDPDPMISTHFYKTKLHAPDESLNSLIEKTRAALDPAERLKAFMEFGRYVHDQAYLLEVHSVDSFWAARKIIRWDPRESGRAGTLLFRLSPRP